MIPQPLRLHETLPSANETGFLRASLRNARRMISGDSQPSQLSLQRRVGR